MAVGEVEELEGDALLVCGTAEGGEEHVDQPCISRTFVQTVVLEGGKGNAGERDGCWLRLRLGRL